MALTPIDGGPESWIKSNLRVAASFAAFHQEFASLFRRKEAQQRSEQYLRGLLVQQADRRNAENISEAVDGAIPRSLQCFLTESPWSDEPVIDQLQGHVARLLTGRAAFSSWPKQDFPKRIRNRSEWHGQVRYVASGETRYLRDWPPLVVLLPNMLSEADDGA